MKDHKSFKILKVNHYDVNVTTTLLSSSHLLTNFDDVYSNKNFLWISYLSLGISNLSENDVILWLLLSVPKGFVNVLATAPASQPATICSLIPTLLNIVLLVQ